MKDIRVTVWKVLYDAQTSASVVLLQTEDEARVLPVWVGQSEALSIAAASEKISLGRPVTHDLLKDVVDAAGMLVAWVKIRDLKEGTFLADIRLVRNDSSFDLDARPSDAVALALRCDAPIFVSENVLSDALREDSNISTNLEELAEDFLENLPDEIFGKYKM